MSSVLAGVLDFKVKGTGNGSHLSEKIPAEPEPGNAGAGSRSIWSSGITGTLFNLKPAAMNRFPKEMEIVHDLLVIQQERANAYQAIARYNDQEAFLCKFLRKIAMQCRDAFLELRRHIDMSYGDPADRVEIRGEIVREWPGVKAFVPGSSFKELVEACEWNEVRATMAYQKALTSGDALSRELLRIIYGQLKSIRESFAFIHECKEKPTAPAVAREENPPHFIYTDQV